MCSIEQQWENQFPDCRKFFEDGGTKRKAIKLIDSGQKDWSDGAIEYFYQQTRQPVDYGTPINDGLTARERRILRTSSSNKSTVRKFS